MNTAHDNLFLGMLLALELIGKEVKIQDSIFKKESKSFKTFTKVLNEDCGFIKTMESVEANTVLKFRDAVLADNLILTEDEGYLEELYVEMMAILIDDVVYLSTYELSKDYYNILSKLRPIVDAAKSDDTALGDVLDRLIGIYRCLGMERNEVRWLSLRGLAATKLCKGEIGRPNGIDNFSVPETSETEA